jgi:hypothetical protein
VVQFEFLGVHFKLNHYLGSLGELEKRLAKLKGPTRPDLEPLEELLARFRSVCLDADGNTEPAEKKRIAEATKALR